MIFLKMVFKYKNDWNLSNKSLINGSYCITSE